MSLTPFADRQARVNRAVFSHLSDAQALLDGEPITGMYYEPGALGAVGIGMATTQPVLVVQRAALRCDPVGRQLVMLDGEYTTWRVAAAEPDGAGVLRLVLELP